jgi:hypothetical protein
MNMSHPAARFMPTMMRKGGAPTSTNTKTISTTPPSAAPAEAPSDAAADFRALFSSHSNPPAAAPTPPVSTAAPTAQSLFGPNPWMTNPGGTAPNGVTYGYNPYYFATADTAAKVAQMVGGTVVQSNAITPYGPFQQNAPNYMVQLPDGRQIYAGIFASFYDHGYTQEFVNRLVASEVNGTGTEMKP